MSFSDVPSKPCSPKARVAAARIASRVVSASAVAIESRVPTLRSAPWALPPSLAPMPFSAALSEHPLATHAVGEVVGHVLDELGEAPDLAILFVGAAHTGAIEDIASAVRTLLRPGVLI